MQGKTISPRGKTKGYDLKQSRTNQYSSLQVIIYSIFKKNDSYASTMPSRLLNFLLIVQLDPTFVIPV